MVVQPCSGYRVRCYFINWTPSLPVEFSLLVPGQGIIRNGDFNTSCPVKNGSCGKIPPSVDCVPTAAGFPIDPVVPGTSPLVIKNQSISPFVRYLIYSEVIVDGGGPIVTNPAALPTPTGNEPLIPPQGEVRISQFAQRAIGNGVERTGIRVFIGGSTGYSAIADLYWEATACFGG